ncbi:hypothetical protein ACKS0A_12019 [Histoplasma ohiense]
MCFPIHTRGPAPNLRSNWILVKEHVTSPKAIRVENHLPRTYFCSCRLTLPGHLQASARVGKHRHPCQTLVCYNL